MDILIYLVNDSFEDINNVHLFECQMKDDWH